MAIQIPQNVREVMSRHARETYPEECCGFLFGEERVTNGQEETRLIHTAVKAHNIHEGDKRRRFRIDPKDYLRAEQFAAVQGITLLGIYHSHPDHPARPSEHDREQAVPFFSYVIVSLDGEKVKEITSWRLTEERTFEEEQVIE